MNANKKKEHAPGPLKVVEDRHGRVAENGSRALGRVIVTNPPDNTFRHFATAYGAGADADANAAEIVRRWNAHEELVKACELALRGLTQGLLPDDPAVLATLRVAIARSAPPGLSERCGAYPPSPGEWRCICVPRDPACDTRVNPPFVSACTSCGARRP